MGTDLKQLSIIVVCAFIFTAVEANAGKPVALALDVSGPTTPAVEPFSELESKSPIELGPDTTIEFLHYATCQAVTVQGGRLNFTNQRYLFKGGKIVEKKRAECPKQVALSGASQIGGVVLRGPEKKKVRGTTRPSFVIVGAQANSFVSIEFSENGTPLLQSKLDGRIFHFPGSAAALEKGKTYQVTLTPRGAGERQKFNLKAQFSPKKNALTLIRVD